MKFTVGLAVIVWAMDAPGTMAFAPFAMLPPTMEQQQQQQQQQHIVVAATTGNTISAGPTSLLISSNTKPPSAISIDKDILKTLEQETREAEREAKAEERKAKAEKARETFFEYEAKMAAEQEARIEAAEQKALAEAIKDKEEAEKLKNLEQRVEQEAATALTKKEKIAKQKEARVSNNIMFFV
jgi:hypothetical protein